MGHNSTQNISEIEICSIHGNSVLTTSKIFKPLKIFPLYEKNVCHLVFSNYGGGFVEGDSILMNISLASNTKTIFSNQANTRIYKSVDKGGSRHVLKASLGQEALAVYLAEPVVPHESSLFEQVSHWSLSKDAVLLSLEWFEAGRLLNGERFSFENFSSELKVDIEENTVAWDKFTISPRESNVNSPGAFLDHSCYVNIFLIGNDQLQSVQLLEEHLKTISAKYFHEESPELIGQAGILGAWTKISSQVQMVRCSARTHEQLSAFVKEIASVLEEEILLGFNPLKRKF